MKNMLAFLATVVLIFSVMGLCLGWFGVAGYENNGGIHRISIDINTIKMGSDYQVAQQKLAETIAKFQETRPQQPGAGVGAVGDLDTLEQPPAVELPGRVKP